MLYTLNIYNAIYQLYLKKLSKKLKESDWLEICYVIW